MTWMMRRMPSLSLMSPREATARELFSAVIGVASHLLSQRQRNAWRDINPDLQKQQATALLNALEDNAFLLAHSIHRPAHITRENDNIRK